MKNLPTSLWSRALLLFAGISIAGALLFSMYAFAVATSHVPGSFSIFRNVVGSTLIILTIGIFLVVQVRVFEKKRPRPVLRAMLGFATAIVAITVSAAESRHYANLNHDVSNCIATGVGNKCIGWRK